MNAQMRLRCRAGFRSRIFWTMLLGAAILSYLCLNAMSEWMALTQCSFFEVLMYALSNFHAVIWGFIPLFVIAVADHLAPDGMDWYVTARSGTRAFVRSQFVALGVQAVVFVLGIVLGSAAAAFSRQTPFFNEWSFPGLFSAPDNLNEYYSDTVLFELRPALAAAIQAALLAGWLYLTALLAFSLCILLTDTKKSVAATIGVHLVGLGLYFLPAGGDNFISFYDSFFLYEYMKSRLGMCILRTVLLAVVGAGICHVSVRFMRRFSWERLVNEK